MNNNVPKSLYGYANFITKPQSEDLIPKQKYIIEYQIKISLEEFEKLILDPLEDKTFIQENIELMYTDDDGCWHCLLVTAEGYSYGVLIESGGYSYARYAAIITL